MSDMMSMAGALSPEQMQMQQATMNGAPPNTNGAPQPIGMGGQDVAGGDMQAMFETVASPLVDFVQGDGRPQVVEVLGANQDDVGSAAGLLISQMLIAQMTEAARQANARIPAEVIGQTSLQLSNLLADIAIEEQIIPEEEGDDIADDAFYNSLADIGEQAPKELITPEDEQVFQQMLADLDMAEQQRESEYGMNGDSGGMGMNAGIGQGMGATNMAMAAQTAPGAPVEDASIMNAGRFDGNPNGGSLNG